MHKQVARGINHNYNNYYYTLFKKVLQVTDICIDTSGCSGQVGFSLQHGSVAGCHATLCG